MGKKESNRAENLLVKPKIFVYHKIVNYLSANPYEVSKKRFFKQIKFLISNGYQPVDLPSVIKNEASNSGKNFVITFDDGDIDTVKLVSDILQEFKIPATIFLITANLKKKPLRNGERYFNLAEIEKLKQKNFNFGSHTQNHLDLTKISVEQARQEIRTSKLDLERLGIESDFLAYPYGHFNKQVKLIAQEARYTAAFSVTKGGRDFFEVRRIPIYAFDNQWLFRLRLSGYYPGFLDAILKVVWSVWARLVLMLRGRKEFV
jgi:peptidoglycan/xylan/chitin deacetylase (PgdA/CDA1 family)